MKLQNKGSYVKKNMVMNMEIYLNVGYRMVIRTDFKGVSVSKGIRGGKMRRMNELIGFKSHINNIELFAFVLWYVDLYLFNGKMSQKGVH